ncbi:YccF domain-containing protein [Proteiniclasticum sp. SCR006]|uniref:YccF domain-containing protein n=1 Tax=Proteiniclasticum aestuarii TaxID=2817862 RepID=A0A939KJ89_9CLOT|nr:YccF domain-containing protein [Proteiniclasticum aestuarii]MBO1264796.1 YccF domain-containing protein [Proteiniclasticum aestuarii]
MSILGNLIWFLLGGFIPALLWFFFGLLWSITIIGIPVGVQCFKMASLQLFPFGKDVSYSSMGAGSLLINIIWIVVGGIELAVANVLIGLFFCMTIIGIPFGLQNFKMAKLSLMPFGAKIIHI